MTHPLRSYRHQAGLSLEEVAQKVGVTRSFVAKIEKGAAFPSMSVVGRLIEATDGAVTANDFLPSRRDHDAA